MSTEMLQPIAARPANLTDMVVDTIQNAIIDKSLRPGAAISEASLASALNVSKTPVREALLRLRHIGLVVPADRGMRVVSPSPQLIRYAYELRAGLERSAALMSGERASENDLEEIESAAKSSVAHAEAHDADGFRSCDLQFHTLIARSTKNPLLLSAVSDAATLTRALRARDVRTTGDSILCAQEHLAISAALNERDGETAARRTHHHINHVMAIVLGGYSDATPEVGDDS
ncbi:GntR family transcriptional regulator [Rhodococcoides fascians]|uniref:GntR family transcriptional regulator n=1 Tax=Rhodococcoides fascians TaxID=1828 RepID=UPI001E403194|nr:GntR family transcriptional regulator [Rhodococcus fascians]